MSDADATMLSVETMERGCATAVGGAARGSACSATRGPAVGGRARQRRIVNRTRGGRPNHNSVVV